MATPTLKDFYEVYGSIPDPFADEAINARIEAFYDAVVEEQCLKDANKFAALPYTTVLGKKAQSALKVLKEVATK